jgi:hypothetical protein
MDATHATLGTETPTQPYSTLAQDDFSGPGQRMTVVSLVVTVIGLPAFNTGALA